ncbi:MAG: ABC transporter ATP-binding protein [Blautia sp.]|nr:ABC transporter ATP-binding protein [Blautia sp.]
MNQVSLELRNVTKRFEKELVLDGISLQVEKGEFLTLLGSSGCGKTTTLRIIAGLETPDQGQVLLNGEDVTALPPEKRAVNTIFQSYALFPHMTVEENVGYALKLRRVPRQEIRKRTSEMLDLVRLSGFEKRKPEKLSGGQKQRVAIARALIGNPGVLLLDEPLGALDLQLRRTMQRELKRLQQYLGVTFIYVTHDQEEAINMSDRIAVMHRGRLEQIGTPDEIYNHPRTSYAARFVGNANLFTGMVESISEEGAWVSVSGGRVLLGCPAGTSLQKGEKATFAVRSENVQVLVQDQEGCAAVVKEKSFLAGQLRLILSMPDGRELAASRFGIDSDFEPGQKVKWTFPARQGVLLDREEQNA